PLLEVLYPATDEAETSESIINETAYTQPALFALEYALAQLWLSWGIQPSVVMGHSVGEYVAACIAGVFSLEDGLKLIAARGRLMQALPQDGTMLVVAAPVEQVQTAIAAYPQEVAIAAVNGPQNVVISGRTEAINTVGASFQATGIKTTQLTVSHAFHSPCMDPMLAEFDAIAQTIHYAEPRIKFISNVTGSLATAQVAAPVYWVQHVRQPVEFAAGMATLHEQGCRFFIEVGPKPTLLSMGRQCLDEITERQGDQVNRDHADITTSSPSHPLTQSSASPTMYWLPCLRHGQDDCQTLLTSLGTLYCQGQAIDWEGFHRNSLRRKVVLPTYPFQRQRYWLSDDIDLPTVSVDREQPVRPLIDRMVQSPLLNEILFETALDLNRQPFLVDHQVYDQVVMPGAGYLSLILNAVELMTGSPACSIEEVVFRKSLVLPTDQVRTLQLVLTPVDEPANNHYHNGQHRNGTQPTRANASQGFTFKIISLPSSHNGGPAPFILHVTGRITLISQQISSERDEVQAWQATCPNAINRSSFYEQLGQGGVHWGDAFRWLEQGWWGKRGESLARLQTPSVVISAHGFMLHPGLLDSCFQMVGLAPETDAGAKTLVPFSLENLQLYQKPSGRALWCYAEEAGPQRWNLILAEADGTVVARLMGYEVTEVRPDTFANDSTQDAWQDWLYEVAWEQVERSADSHKEANEKLGSEPGHWIIYGDQDGLSKQLARTLVEQGHSCVVVAPDDTYQSGLASSTGLYTRTFLNPFDPDHVKRLLQEESQTGMPCRGVLYLWSAEAAHEGVTEPEVAHFHSTVVLRLVQALSFANMTAPLWLVTRSAQAVAGHLPQQVGAAALWGLGRTIALEHAELAPVCVDLGPTPSFTAEAQALCSELFAPPTTSGSTETQLAFYGDNRYVARLERTTVEPDAPALSSDGSYLVTGGLGGLGLKVAEFLVAQGARHLVLVGRSGATAAAQSTIDQLQDQGAQVTVVQGNISEEVDVARLIAACPQPLRGIVHAAGVLRDGVLVQQSPENFTQVMAPKAVGAWHLHCQTRDLPLDFFVCFSSATATFGSLGQGNYAAANAFLDGLAHHRRGLGLPGLSINWGSWAEVGMAARLDARDQARIAAQGESAMAPEAGLQVLAALLQQESAQVTVSAIQWSKFLTPDVNGALPAFYTTFERYHTATTPSVSQGTPTPDLSSALAGLDLTAQQSLLVAYVQRQLAAIIGVSTSEVDVAAPLPMLGLDSLMSIDIRNQIKRDLGLDVPIVKLLEGINLVELAEWIGDSWRDTHSGFTTSTELRETAIAPALPVVESTFEEVAGEL
ncbi:MAG: SDR family NAD(P)-dependent oxidoreductase, partial [Chloroflexota bacterium]